MDQDQLAALLRQWSQVYGQPGQQSMPGAAAPAPGMPTSMMPEARPGPVGPLSTQAGLLDLLRQQGLLGGGMGMGGIGGLLQRPQGGGMGGGY